VQAGSFDPVAEAGCKAGHRCWIAKGRTEEQASNGMGERTRTRDEK
jgi:hypothetical protein